MERVADQLVKWAHSCELRGNALAMFGICAANDEILYRVEILLSANGLHIPVDDHFRRGR
jgi:hypothetical protein